MTIMCVFSVTNEAHKPTSNQYLNELDTHQVAALVNCWMGRCTCDHLWLGDAILISVEIAVRLDG